MRPTLLLLHGYTMNGAGLRAHMGPLVGALEAHADLVFLDAPLTCSPDGVDRLYAMWSAQRPPGPHLTWWDASDDGRVYAGFDEARAALALRLEAHQPVGVLGFSQGAMMVAVLAALASQGALPPIRFAVAVAGGLPRAEALQHLFTAPIPIPSLHVWGEQDALSAPRAPRLAEAFEEPEVVVWSGPHAIPTSGHPAARLVDFVARQALDRAPRQIG